VTARPFRFGLVLPGAASPDEWAERCRAAEHQGYGSILVPDHFNNQWALIPALTAAALAAPRLRIGALVACNDYRNPVMYAKELATIDLLSGGRVEWGMGAGWLGPEYEQAGIPFDPPPVRVSRFIEAVHLMRSLFAGQPVTTNGPAYELQGVAGHPLPVQRPHPPLMIGASARRMLRFAAREADIISVNPSLMAHPAFAGDRRVTAPEAADRQLGWIREAAGERLERLELNMVAFPAFVTDDGAGRAATYGEKQGIPGDEVLASPHALIGTVDEICEGLEERRARWGVSYWAVPAMLSGPLAPVVERMAGR
jgi:probable F420-dependent oxidoreductase